MPGPSPPAPVSKEQIFDQCVASLSLSSATACAGERIEGTFKVQVRQDLKVRSIRVVLECWEKAGDQEEKTKVTNILLLKNNILGGTLTTNQMLEWPIRLQVPKNILPSAGTSEDNTQVVWRVKGILNRFMLRDLEVQQQIHVYIDPQGS